MKFLKYLKIKIVFIFAMIGVIALTFTVTRLFFKDNVEEIRETTIWNIIESSSDLVTTKYTYRDIAEYEQFKDFYGIKIPFTTDHQLIVYDGQVAFSVDLTKSSVSMKDNSIQIKLPKVSILYHTLDISSFKVYNIQSSIFTDISMGDYAQFMERLKLEKSTQLLSDSHLLEEVKYNTEKALMVLLKNIELVHDKQFEFLWEE